MRASLLLLAAMFAYADPPWMANVQVSHDPGTGNQNETTLGVFGTSQVCGGWNDSRQTVYHVGFGRSFNGGTTFTDTLLIEPTYPADCDPCIVVNDSGHIYYFILSYNPSTTVGDVYFCKSTNWGLSWGPYVSITPGTPNSLDDKPWAIIDRNNIFFSWYDYGGTGMLRFKRSTDLGQTWMTAVSVGSSGNGTMCVRGTDSVVGVGWGYQDLRFNRSTNMGAAWLGQSTIVTCPWSPPATSYRINNIPCFKTNRNRTAFYVAFSDSRWGSGQLDVSFSKSTNQGSSWSTPVKINDTPAGDTTLQFYPFIAVDPLDNIHVVWYDTRGGSRNYVAFYYSYSTDGGATWQANQRVSDNRYLASTFIGDYSSCAVDSDYIYALWCDCRNGSGNPDVFFSKAVNEAGIHESAGPAGPGTGLSLDVPNPMNVRSAVRFRPADAELSIFQADGRRTGRMSLPGVYFIVLRKGADRLCRKVVVVE